jgi:hypothetical protein
VEDRMAASKAKVPFTMENGSKCVCVKCPVQSNSKCVKKLMGKLMEMVKTPGAMPKPKDMPGLYCSVGKTSCKDIDTKKSCTCATCAIWANYKLASGKPVYYFCKNGKAV